MSYQVIARKWRPKAFADLVGQSHISQTLLNALKSERLPHAMIFTGPRGTGKTSSARILAKSLRCPNAVEHVPCGTCSECVEINNGSSIDVIEIDGASNNGVDAIRELRDTIGYMPSSGHHKVYIIDEVHMLSTSAFNALLKTLEEPPEHVVFVMATTEVHKIPNTILSRCQRFDFRRIPIRQLSERLKLICENDGVKANEDALWMIARQGDGSMRDCQSLLDQVITFCSGDITLEKVVDVLGLTNRGLLTTTLQALVERNTQKIVQVINDVFLAGYDPKVFAQDLLEELRNLLVIKLSPERATDLVDLPDSEIAALTELGNSLGQEDIHLLFDMALKGADEIPRAQDPRVVLEMLLLRMSAAPRIAPLSQVVLTTGGASQNLSAPQANTSSRPTQQTNTSSSATTSASNTATVSRAEAQTTHKLTADVQAQKPSESQNFSQTQNSSFVRHANSEPTNTPQSVQPSNPQNPQATHGSSPQQAGNSSSQNSNLGASSPATHQANGLTNSTESSQSSNYATNSGATQFSGPNDSASAQQNSTPSSQATSSAQAPAPQPEKKSFEPTPPSGNSTQDWTQFVQRIKKVNGIVAAKLEHSYLVSISDSKVVEIAVPPKMKFLFEQIKEAGFQKKINNYMTTFWGPGYSIDVQLGDEKKSQILTPMAIEKKQVQTAKDEIRRQVEGHSLIQSAQNVFKSEIKEIKEMR